MKILVLYTTIDGNTEAVAEKIAEKVGADSSKIVRVSKIRGYGLINKIRARFEVMFNRRPGIFPFKWDPRDYDLIFIGTPVWYNSYNPVFNTLFEVIKIYDRKIALFSTGETESQKALDKFSKKLQDSVILGRYHCVEPIWEDEDLETERILNEAADWAQGIADEANRMIEQEEFERRKTIYKF
jgi:flavodoxin